MSVDQWSHENNPIKMLQEILKCLLTSGLMKITPKNVTLNSQISFDQCSHML